MLALGVQCIGSDVHTVKFRSLFQHRFEIGDLTMRLGHVLLHEHGPGNLVDDGREVDSGAAAVLGATDFLPVDGYGSHRGHGLGPCPGQSVQGVSLQTLEQAGPWPCRWPIQPFPPTTSPQPEMSRP